MNLRKATATGLVLLAALIVAFGLTASSPDSGGVTQHRYQTLVPGTKSYTETFESNAVDVGLFGSIETQLIMSVRPATETITSTAQWSEQPVPCSQVTAWTTVASTFNPNGLSYTQDQTILTTVLTDTEATTTTVTATSSTTWAGSGAMTYPFMTFVSDGSDADSLDVIGGVPVMARCFRIVFEPLDAAAVFTPTVYIRMVNHQ